LIEQIGQRVIRVENWPQELSPPWLVNVGGIKVCLEINSQFYQRPICDLCHTHEAIRQSVEKVNYCNDCTESAPEKTETSEITIDIGWHIDGAGMFLDAVAGYLLGNTTSI
jgi:hypothetical protein